MGNNTVEHQKLVDDILFAVGSTPMARTWKQVNGVFLNSRTGEPLTIGVPGSGDVSGILKNGIRLEIECKTGKAVLSDKQKDYRKMIQAFGGCYITARSIDDALLGVQTALNMKG